MGENSREFVFLGYLINVVAAIGLVLIVAKAVAPETRAATQLRVAISEEQAAAETTTAATGVQSVAAMSIEMGPTAPGHVVAAVNKGGCAGCHVIPGVPGANGQLGPDLSTIGVDATSRIDGYTVEQYITESILDPNAFIAPTCPNGPCPPGVMLQSFAQTLSETDLTQIVDYLALLGTDDEASLLAESAEPVELSRALPPESVLEPFAPLPKDPADEARIALGKYLFFDQRLSGNNSLSCASCHQPENAFTDGQALSRGYPSTSYFRNTPTVMNTVYASYLYRDGRMDGGDMPTLVRDHLTEAHFMSMDGRLMWERLYQVPAYVDLFNEVYGSGPSFGGVLNAITAYVQTLNSPPSPYDQYVAGDESTLSEDAIAGLALFEGEAGCSDCHSGVLFSDDEFYNIGVGTDPALFEDPERHLTFRRFFRILGTPNYRELNEDVGLYALTLEEADRGKFRTPSLREVAQTAPYMHNGSFATLPEVIQFYNQGGGPTQTAELAPLNLADTQVEQLVAFLESLSSEPIAVAPPELPDYGLVALGDSAGPPDIVAILDGTAIATEAVTEAEEPATDTGDGDATAEVTTETTEADAETTETETTEAEAASDLDIDAVSAIVIKGTCNACHVIPGIDGAVGVVGPNMENIGLTAAERIDGYSAEEYLYESILEPDAFIAPECPFGPCVPGSMPATLSATLSEEEITLLVDYLLSLEGGQ